MKLRPGLLTLYSSVILLSINGLFAKSIPLDSTSITLLRSIIAFAGLSALFCFRGLSFRPGNLRTAGLTYLLGFMLGLHWLTFFQAMQISTVAIGIIALFSYPVITVLIEPLFRKSWPQKADLFAALTVFLGILVMMSSQRFASIGPTNVDTSQGNIAAGISWGLLSALLFSLRNTCQKYLIAHVPSTRIMLHQVLAVSLMLILFADWQSIPTLSSFSWLLLAALGLICTAGAHTLLSISLKHLQAKSVALIGCLQPLLAAIFAWLVLQEQPSMEIMIGGAIVLSVAAYESLRK